MHGSLFNGWSFTLLRDGLYRCSRSDYGKRHGHLNICLISKWPYIYKLADSLRQWGYSMPTHSLFFTDHLPF